MGRRIEHRPALKAALEARSTLVVDGGLVSAEVIPLRPGARRGWVAGTVTCGLCAADWVAVYPASSPLVECPTCHQMVPPPWL